MRGTLIQRGPLEKCILACDLQKVRIRGTLFIRSFNPRNSELDLLEIPSFRESISKLSGNQRPINFFPMINGGHLLLAAEKTAVNPEI
ncbi:MAG: hypothetical protein DF168_01586 [Candidatus Moanabacter tarae]|uniref:Uncharacterized protein n=1 Tax=Candidatus Moanibacter tarae TaxID=2200854 RepID=A0A2Z4AJN9_9BACT|nr:MAG: hypothetical protein DF168_01586 [Candidatus Moanabacter tarae]